MSFSDLLSVRSVGPVSEERVEETTGLIRMKLKLG